MAPAGKHDDGVELLRMDEVQRQADQGSDLPPALNLSGAIDILSQLKSGAPALAADAADVVVEVVENEAPSVFMADFFAQVKGVKAELGEIRGMMKEVKDLQAKIITEVSKQKSKEYTETLDEQLRNISLKAKKIKGNLQRMQQAADEKFAQDKDSAESRTHANMHGALTRKFVEVMGDFQEIQSTYKKHLRDRVARQVKVANPAATEDEIQKAVDTGGGDIFTDKLLSRADQTALNAYADVQSKHEELIKLESSIREVHQLFMDMAILVEQQGELLDNIEDIVSHAATYTEQGVTQLVKAKDLQKKMRKKMCCLTVCFAFGLLLLVTWVTAFVPGI
uniref:t-SNARE coiled-coil homology domain-containing protein n=2 Tax=Hemiselmis andersenii TaxID=464988 RepID=A0A7S1EC66_HEMAN